MLFEHGIGECRDCIRGKQVEVDLEMHAFGISKQNRLGSCLFFVSGRSVCPT